MTIIEVANISAEVEWKNIKNVHLTIYPPNARVHVSAPIGSYRLSVLEASG